MSIKMLYQNYGHPLSKMFKLKSQKKKKSNVWLKIKTMLFGDKTMETFFNNFWEQIDKKLFWKWSFDTIVKIDSITPSFCLRHYVRNGLSYSAEETRSRLCKLTPSFELGIRSKRTNKHQLLHRITSIKTPLIYNNTFIFPISIYTPF